MATIHALLITTKINQPVKIKFRYKEGNSVDLLYTSSIKVFPADWDKKYQAIKINSSITKQQRTKINNEVQKIKNDIIDFVENTDGSINNTSLKEHLSRLYNTKQKTQKIKKVEKVNDFFTIFDNFLLIHPLSAERKESYIVVVNALKRFEFYKKQSDNQFALNFTTFSESILLELENYLAAEYDYLKVNRQLKKQFPNYKSNKPRSQNTINGNLSKVRTFFNWCIKRKYTN